MTRIAIIAGSTRPGRKSEEIARWVFERAAKRTDATFEVVDLADHDLPLLDEPVAAAMGADYRHEHTRAWSRRIAAFDGFVFVTPEYNHSFPAVLKNALDYLYTEWHDKAAGCVGYSIDGGIRAVEQLRLVLAELHMPVVRRQVALALFDDVDEDGRIAPRAHHGNHLDTLLDQVIAWTEALGPLRSGIDPATRPR